MAANSSFTSVAIVIGILAALLALVVLFVLFLMLRRAVRSSSEEKTVSAAARSGSPPAAIVMLGASKLDLARSFAQALRRLKALTDAYGWRYSTPWYLMLGEKGAGKSTILGSLSALHAGEPDFEAVPGQQLSWHFLNQGVVLDIAGRMVLGTDTQPADERSWRHILKLLAERRPQRPADGVILTISCSDFVGPGRLNSDALLAKADQLRHRLIELGQKFGLQLPVYVIVSKCDLIAGFQSFWREISPHHRTEIFGWSNPRDLDSEVTPADFDGEFDGVTETLYRLHLEIAGRERNAVDPEGALLFPSEFERLRDSLRLYCLGLFRRDVYHDAFFFRGVYFTGDGGPPGQMLLSSNLPSSPAAPVSPRPFLLFAQDLFARKILPEGSLAAVARPGRALHSRPVRIAAGILAGFILIGGSGLTYAGLRLNRDSAALLQPISFIVQSTSRAQDRERNAAQEPMNGADDARLLQMFARLNVRYLHSVWLPSSWFSSLDHRIIDHFSLGFDTVILDAMRRTLERRASAVMQEAAAPGGPAQQGKSYALAGSPEGKRLVQYVDALRQIEASATIYNRLGTPNGSLADLEQLTNRLLNTQLPHDFFVDSDLYSTALHQVTVRPFDAAIYRPQAVQELQAMYPQLEHLMADDGPILGRFAGIPDSLDDLDRTAVTGGREMDQPLARLRDSLSFAQTALADRDFAWFSASRIDADPQFSQLLRQIASSAFLGPQAADELRQRGDQYLAAAQDQLTGISFQGSTQLLDRSGTDMTFHAAPPLNDLFTAVPKLLARPFMAAPESVALPDANSAAMTVWDPGQLEQAINLDNGYEQFVASDLQSVPVEFRRSIDTAARQRLEANIDAAIAKAEIPYTPSGGGQTAEADLFFQTQAFARASQPLGNILSVLSQNGLTRSYNQLRDFAGLQAYRLLQRIDQDLDSAQLYALRNDVRPQAQLATPMLASFGFRSDAELTQYLQGQRNRIIRLATTGAQPLVDFLSRSDFSSTGRPTPLLPKWQRIVLDIGEAENGAPANPVSELEDFLRVDLARVTRDNCAEQLAPDRTGIAGDYFLDRRNALRQVLYGQCLAAGRTGAAAAYAQLAERFNASLAGRFPFAPAGTNAPDAIPDAVTDYLRLLAASAPAVEKEFARQAIPAQRPALIFLQQMEKVRTFFAAFPDATPDDPPGFDVTADFRINRRFEAGADQIIGWELVTGDHLFQQGDAVKPFRWHVSDPVTVNLRWAKDGPVAPANGSSDRVVSWKYQGNWALLRLIEDRRARAEEIDPSAMLAPHVLKFTAETAPVAGAPGATPSPAPVKQATAFIGVHLSSTPPGEKAPVNVVLPEFPARAPALQSGANVP